MMDGENADNMEEGKCGSLGGFSSAASVGDACSALGVELRLFRHSLEWSLGI
jgi:hypothetical protein